MRHDEHDARLLALVLPLCAFGCTASIEDASTSAARPEQQSPGTAVAPGGPRAATAGPMPLRRLTTEELSNTLEDLLGNTSRPGATLPDEPEGPSGFGTPGPLSALEYRQYVEITEAVADSAAADLGKILPCDPAKGEEACATAFIQTFGRKAWRRKPVAAESKDLQALYTRARGEFKYDFKGAIGLVLQAMLQDPAFLYRWELGPSAPAREGELVKLGGDEVASRLSYLLWGSMPDDALFKAADAGQLGTPAAVEAQARRMLADPKARRALASFHAQWLDVTHLATLQKDTMVYPSFTPDVPASLERELAAFVADVYQAGDGKLGTLLTAPYSFVDAALGKIYGVDASGMTPVKKSLDPAQRAGILTQLAFLARHGNTYESHPVRRGKAVLQRVMCGTMPPPPGNIPLPKPPAADLSVRERYVEHSGNPQCRSCHTALDPLGFAFETYDGIGGWQKMDGGKPVDATGTVTLGGTAKPFKNALELVRLLAASEEVSRCMTSQWARFGLGRPDEDDDRASLDEAYAAFARSGLDLRELLVAFVRSKTFLYRRPAAGEVL